jgi:hypothetical protein
MVFIAAVVFGFGIALAQLYRVIVLLPAMMVVLAS